MTKSSEKFECPYCYLQSMDIVSTDERQTDLYIREMECNNCGMTFNVVYRLLFSEITYEV
jgi:transcription elongation factor Elf1